MARPDHPAAEAPSRTVISAVDIAAPASTIWKALTQPREIGRWFAPEVSGSGEVGGTIRLDWGGGTTWDMPVRHAEAPTLLVLGDAGPIGHEHRATGADSGAVRIEYRLQPAGAGITRVTVTHSGFGAGSDWDEMYDGVTTGWFYELRSLKHYAEHFFGRDRRVVTVRAPIGDSRETVWKRLLDALAIRPSEIREGATINAVLRDAGPEPVRIFQARPDRIISGFAPNLGDAMVRFGVERCGGSELELWVWLSAHDAAPADVGAFERRWRAGAAAIAG